MTAKAKQRHVPTLADEIASYFAAQEAAKAAYDLADELLVRIARQLKRGVPLQISATEKVILVNNFSGKTVVWGHGGVRKWKLEKVKIVPVGA
jgi:hypothetical protein